MDLNNIVKSLSKKNIFDDRWPSQPQDSSGTDEGRNAIRRGFWGAEKPKVDWGAGLAEGQPDTSMGNKAYTLKEMTVVPGFSSKEIDPRSAHKPNTRGIDEVMELLVPKKKAKGPNDHDGSPMSDFINQILGVEL